jgi:hypothetical protein
MPTFHSASTGVIHRAQIYHRAMTAETACGQRVAYFQPGLDDNGEWTEGYCEWLTQHTSKSHSLCFHCGNREPVWDRRRRERRRSRKRGWR